jgi:triacylglycerol lipase
MKLLRRWWAWTLDYAYIAFWQVLAFFRRAAPGRYGDGDRAPVLILPGVYETWPVMKPLADLLNRIGHPVHVVRTLGRNRGRVPEMAKRAAAYVAAADLTGVVIVAHSKGGLIGKYLMANLDPDDRIDRMVALNTPFAGSLYARWIPGATMRDFSPTDVGLLALSEQIEVNARVTSIYGDFDPHIPGGSELVGATNLRLHTMGHFRTISQPVVAAAVLAAVDPEPSEPEPDHPGR